MVRDARVEHAVCVRALPVLLTRAELCGRRLPGRIDGSDVDLVAGVLEVQELGWDAVLGVMRKNDALEESGDGNVDREDSKHISANNVLKIDGSPSDAAVNEVRLVHWSH